MKLFGKKNSEKAGLSKDEIGQLKQQLKEKMDEYRDIYDQLVEVGGAELPEEILDQVAGGIVPVVPTSSPPSTTISDGGYSGGVDRT